MFNQKIFLAIGQLDHIISIDNLGAMGSFLGFILSLLLNREEIVACFRGKDNPPESARPPMNTDVASLVGDLFLSLAKTALAICVSIIFVGEYLFAANNYHLINWPQKWILTVSLVLGGVIGSYLRARGWLFILFIGTLLLLGVLALSDWDPTRLYILQALATPASVAS